MRFSERKGYKEISKIIQTDDVNLDLRVALWNIFYTTATPYFGKVTDFKKTYWASYKKKDFRFPA